MNMTMRCGCVVKLRSLEDRDEVELVGVTHLAYGCKYDGHLKVTKLIKELALAQVRDQQWRQNGWSYYTNFVTGAARQSAR